MPPAIQSVAVIGAAGNLGVFIVNSLLQSNFKVTAISRATSSTAFPSEVTVKKVDFTSKDSLVAALQGHDALVSVIGTMATGEQRILVDAAVEAKIKRFIPSEYGLNTRTVGRTTKLGKMLASKIQTVDYLIEQAEKNEWFSWTGLGNNLFFDWSLAKGFLGFDIPSKKATIVDSGNEAWSSTNLALIGQAVAAVLQKPDETRNKYLMISSFTTTQNELLRVLEEESGVKFDVTRKTAAETESQGDQNLATGQAYKAFWDFVGQYQFADRAAHALQSADSANELLGLSHGDLRESVKKVLLSSK